MGEKVDSARTALRAWHNNGGGGERERVREREREGKEEWVKSKKEMEKRSCSRREIRDV
jgi:hypothetical protein